jgi:hypothetical protein
MSSELVAALVGASAVLGGILVQSYVTRASSLSDKRRELLIAAYEDFLIGLTLLSSVNEADHPSGMQRLLAGKQKIAAYAPVGVLRAVAILEGTSLKADNPDAQAAIVGVVVEMRRSVGVVHEGIDREVKALLFGK